MVALLQKFAAIASSIAFQDSENPQRFLYVPTLIQETSEEIKVTYWGYEKQFLQEQDNIIKNVIGVVISGQSMLHTIEPDQQALIDQIRKRFNLQTPQLEPLPLKQIVAIVEIGKTAFPLHPDLDLQFPDHLEAGTPFNFLIGTGTQSFAQFARSQSQELITPPKLALNLIGQAEVQTPAWEVLLEVNLAQAWARLRRRFAPGIAAAWTELKLEDLEAWLRGLLRDRTLKVTPKQGTVDLEKSQWQRIEIARFLLNALNQQPDLPANFVRVYPYARGATSPWENWKVQVNLIYGERSMPAIALPVQQTLPVQTTYSIPIRLNLHLRCETFQDLGNLAEPCFTVQKIEAFQRRLKEEQLKQSAIAQTLYNRLVAGELTLAQYHSWMQTRAN
jgi:hypothetical protein